MFFIDGKRCLQRKGPEWVKEQQIQVMRLNYVEKNVPIILQWVTIIALIAQVKVLMVIKSHLAVNGKQPRRVQNKMVLHSIVTGWWSLSLKAAWRTGLMWRYRARPSSPVGSAVKMRVGCSHPVCLVRSAVWDRGPQGFAESDWLLGWGPQLSGGAINLKTWNQPVISSFSTLYKCVDYDLQARNFMRQMKDGQLAFFYHSNCKEPGVAGLMKVSHTLVLLQIFWWLKEHSAYVVGCVNGSCLTKVLDLVQSFSW